MITFDELLRRREAAAYHSWRFYEEEMAVQSDFQMGEKMAFDYLIHLLAQEELTAEKVRALRDEVQTLLDNTPPGDRKRRQERAGIIVAYNWALSQLAA